MEKNRIAFCTTFPLNMSSCQNGETENVGSALPQEFLLLHYGTNSYSKAGANGAFEFTETDADSVIRDFENRGHDLVIDYEHQSLGGEKAPAAGWIDAICKTAEGLSAHVKYWTEEAAKLLSSGEYRYFSPTIYFSRSGKTVSSIHSVALTNHPALHGIPALAAADDDAGAKTEEAGSERMEDFT